MCSNVLDMADLGLSSGTYNFKVYIFLHYALTIVLYYYNIVLFYYNNNKNKNLLLSNEQFIKET